MNILWYETGGIKYSYRTGMNYCVHWYWDILPMLPYQSWTISTRVPWCTTLGKPYTNLALYQANANFGALAQRPFFHIGDVIRTLEWILQSSVTWCWILSLWLPVLYKNTAWELSSSFILKALQQPSSFLVLRRNCGIHKADGCSRTPPGAMLLQPFHYHRSFMYAAVSDISYIANVLHPGRRKVAW